MALKGLGVSLPGAAAGADLGGSSKESSEILEDRSWSRVSWRQQLATSESILSPVTVLVIGGESFSLKSSAPPVRAKGKPVQIPAPGRERVQSRALSGVLRGDPKRLGDTVMAAGKSCLFCLSLELPEMRLPRERDDVAKSAPHGHWRRGVRWAVAVREKPSEGDEERRAGSYRISAAGLRGAQPLVSRAM